jgi:hypothetical protein
MVGARFQAQLPIDAQLDAVRRRDQRIAELNRPALPKPPGIVEQVVGAVAAVVTPVPQTEIARAVGWLADLLKAGQLPEKQVQCMAHNAGIKARTLKRAKRRAGVRSVRIGQTRWDWALPSTGNA